MWIQDTVVKYLSNIRIENELVLIRVDETHYNNHNGLKNLHSKILKQQINTTEKQINNE